MQMRLRRLPGRDWRQVTTHHQAAHKGPITERRQRAQPITGLEPAARRETAQSCQMQQEVGTTDHIRL